MGNTDNYQVISVFPICLGGRITDIGGFRFWCTFRGHDAGQLDPRLASKSIRSTWSADWNPCRSWMIAWSQRGMAERAHISWETWDSLTVWCLVLVVDRMLCLRCSIQVDLEEHEEPRHGVLEKIVSLGFRAFPCFPKKSGNMRKPKTLKPPWKASLHPLWKSSDREADARQCGCYRPASLGYLWPCLQEAAGTVDTSRVETVLMWKWLHLSILFLFMQYKLSIHRMDEWFFIPFQSFQVFWRMARNFLYLIMSRPILAPFAFAFSIQALNFSDALVYGFGPPNSQRLNSKTEIHQQLLLVAD